MSQSSMLISPSGVMPELAEITIRRRMAIELWDGQIHDLWTSLLWFDEKTHQLVERIAERHGGESVVIGLQNCLRERDKVIAKVDRLEVQARAQIRGMEDLIVSAKQGSRMEAHYADQWRLHAADLTLDHLAVAS